MSIGIEKGVLVEVVEGSKKGKRGRVVDMTHVADSDEDVCFVDDGVGLVSSFYLQRTVLVDPEKSGFDVDVAFHDAHLKVVGALDQLVIEHRAALQKKDAEIARLNVWIEGLKATNAELEKRAVATPEDVALLATIKASVTKP